MRYDEAPPRRSTVLSAAMPEPTSATVAAKVADTGRALPPVEASAVALAVAVGLAVEAGLAVAIGLAVALPAK